MSTDPAIGGAVKLTRYDYVYDLNSRKLEDIAYTDAVAGTGQQVTRYGYDSLNRLVVTIYPDSDDTYTTNGFIVIGDNGTATTSLTA